MPGRLFETVLGAVILLGAALFLSYALFFRWDGRGSDLELEVRFVSAAGLETGADVRVNGVKVGRVRSITIDPDLYEAVLVLSLEASLRLPEDTVATVASSGLLGGRYVRLVPGQAKVFLSNHGTIQKTETPLSLEELLGRIIQLVAS